MHSLLKKWNKNKISMNFQPKNLHLKMVLNFIYIYNIIHHRKKKKTQPKIPSTILVLKYIMQNFKLCDEYYFVTNIHYAISFSIFLNF
jgi:hypothetical protein